MLSEVRLQKGDVILGMVRRALGGGERPGEQSEMGEREAARYPLDDQGLVWFELAQRGILVRRTSVLAAPRLLVADFLALAHCHTDTPGCAKRSPCCATVSTGATCADKRGNTCYRADAGVGNNRAASA